MSSNGRSPLAERLAGIEEIECVTPDLNGVPRGKVMTAEGFLEGRRLQLARGVLLQCIMGGYPPARFYGSDDGDVALCADPRQIHRLPWSERPRARSSRGNGFALLDRGDALRRCPANPRVGSAGRKR